MNRLARYIPLLLLTLLVVAVWASGAPGYLHMHDLREHAATLQGLARAHPVLSFATFVGVLALATATSLPGAVVIMMLAGGCLFGTWLGGAANVTGITLGAVVVFSAVRSSLGAALRERAERSGGRLKALLDGVRAGAFGYILTLRLFPFAPFWLVSVAAALAEAPLQAYAPATALGIAPATFIYSGIGAGIGGLLARGQTPRLRMVFSPEVILPLLALGLLSLAATAFVRRRALTGQRDHRPT
jgi:uncharacterized membrane protein YdjX (TVP38/TMEM64 family)